MTGPFCDCPRCGGLSVREEVKPAGRKAAAPMPARAQSRAPRVEDPFDQPAEEDEFSGMTGAIPLTPGLFDGYFQEAAAKPQALDENGIELPPFDQVDDWGIEAGDIHREPTMLLDEADAGRSAPARRPVAPPPPPPDEGASWGSEYEARARLVRDEGRRQDAPARGRPIPAEVSALREAVDDEGGDPFDVEVEVDAFSDSTVAVDQSLYQQSVVEQSRREPARREPARRDIHDESTRLADGHGQPVRGETGGPEALPRPPGGGAGRPRVATAEARVPVSSISAAPEGVDFGAPDASFLDETVAASAGNLPDLQQPPALASEFLQPVAAPAAIAVGEATPGSFDEPADAAELLAAAEAAEAEAAAAAAGASWEPQPDDDDADAIDAAIASADLPVPPDVEPGERELADVPSEVYEDSAVADRVRGEAVFVVDNLPRPQDYVPPRAGEETKPAGPFAALLSAQMLIGGQPPDSELDTSDEFLEGDHDLAEISDRFDRPAIEDQGDEQAGDWVVAVPSKPPPVPPGRQAAADSGVEISSSGLRLPKLELPKEQVEGPTVAAKPGAKSVRTAKGARPAPVSKARPVPAEPAEPRLFS
ncbi:MAG: hypothetical protein JXR83_19990, partial [Deltaproteobacteria bacterium]|nr:hypothetical protein [Deltaproteobacteria bacterium]